MVSNFKSLKTVQKWLKYQELKKTQPVTRLKPGMSYNQLKKQDNDNNGGKPVDGSSGLSSKLVPSNPQVIDKPATPTHQKIAVIQETMKLAAGKIAEAEKGYERAKQGMARAQVHINNAEKRHEKINHGLSRATELVNRHNNTFNAFVPNRKKLEAEHNKKLADAQRLKQGKPIK